MCATRLKHGNHKVVINGEKFDSQREYSRYCQLRLEECAGAISGLCRQVTFILAPPVFLDGRKKPALRYVADFVYVRGEKRIIEDAKSPHLKKEPRYRIKKHLMMSVHNIEIQEA